MNNISRLKYNYSFFRQILLEFRLISAERFHLIRLSAARSICLFAALILSYFSFTASSQNVDSIQSVKNPVAVVDTIIGNYNAWETVELNGKLRMDKLPLSPSVRMFMRNGEEISISVRASFLGEVGRIRIWGDSILAVNKMKRVYALESLEKIKSFYPSVISEVQSLLLGRVVVFGYGELAQTNRQIVDIYELISETEKNKSVMELADTMWSIENSIDVGGIGDIDYRYDLFKDGRINEFIVGLYDHDISLGMDFRYSGNKTAMQIKLQDGEKEKFNATMEFDKPVWNASPMAPLKLNSKYNRVAISQFLKSF